MTREGKCFPVFYEKFSISSALNILITVFTAAIYTNRIKIFLGKFLDSVDFPSSVKRQTFEGFRVSLASGRWAGCISPMSTVWAFSLPLATHRHNGYGFSSRTAFLVFLAAETRIGDKGAPLKTRDSQYRLWETYGFYTWLSLRQFTRRTYLSFYPAGKENCWKASYPGKTISGGDILQDSGKTRVLNWGN